MWMKVPTITALNILRTPIRPDYLVVVDDIRARTCLDLIERPHNFKFFEERFIFRNGSKSR
jgi:hypothetical protein